LLRPAVTFDIVGNMKTTIDIADPLLSEARTVAARQGTTVRALVEAGLREVLARRRKSGAFRLRRATFRGRGLQPGAAGGDWARLRDLSYSGRGS